MARAAFHDDASHAHRFVGHTQTARSTGSSMAISDGSRGPCCR